MAIRPPKKMARALLEVVQEGMAKLRRRLLQQVPTKEPRTLLSQ